MNEQANGLSEAGRRRLREARPTSTHYARPEDLEDITFPEVRESVSRRQNGGEETFAESIATVETDIASWDVHTEVERALLSRVTSRLAELAEPAAERDESLRCAQLALRHALSALDDASDVLIEAAGFHEDFDGDWDTVFETVVGKAQRLEAVRRLVGDGSDSLVLRAGDDDRVVWTVTVGQVRSVLDGRLDPEIPSPWMLSADTQWPCANYTRPRTCISERPTRTGACDWCLHTAKVADFARVEG